MQVPGDFYTAATLVSLTGSATAVWIICSVIGYVLQPRDTAAIKRWLGLVLSMALSLLVASQVSDRNILTWVAAVVNGFLIYLTAVGANTIVATAAVAGSGGSSLDSPPVRKTSAGSSRARGGFAEPWWGRTS